LTFTQYLGNLLSEIKIDMVRHAPDKSTVEPLVKLTVADSLRKEIASGALRPGATIVEGTWARRFGVAQGSIREAINLLAQDGLVTKAAGRSARVVKLSEENVGKIFELRAILEGLAARLIAQHKGDVGAIEDALEMMRQALLNGNAEDMLDADLKFHLSLCELSGNGYLLEYARKVILPLFAFARIRVTTSGQDASVWGNDIDAHQRIVDVIKEGQGDIAEQYTRHAISRFGEGAYHNWEKKPAPADAARTRRRSAKQKDDEAPAG
jgi:DNA-binding GntR family transcriptional regulator